MLLGKVIKTGALIASGVLIGGLLSYNSEKTDIIKGIEKKDKIGIIARTILSMESNTPIEVTDKGLVVDVIDNEYVGVGKGGVRNLRDYMTANETLGAGQRFDDYTTRINEALNSINERLADNTMTLTGSDGRRLSVRNLAEIESRYKMISEDLTRNGINVNDYVVASSHMDASERYSVYAAPPKEGFLSASLADRL